MRMPPAAFALVNSTGFTTRTTDARRANLVPRERISFGMRIDSAPGATLHARMILDVRARPGVVATVRVPLREGAFQVPQFVIQPQSIRPYLDFGRTGGSLPLSQREQVGKHSTTRALIELAALFESAPVAGVTDRRVTHFADSIGDAHLMIDAVRVSRTLRDTVVNGRPARVVRDST